MSSYLHVFSFVLENHTSCKYLHFESHQDITYISPLLTLLSEGIQEWKESVGMSTKVPQDS